MNNIVFFNSQTSFLVVNWNSQCEPTLNGKKYTSWIGMHDRDFFQLARIITNYPLFIAETKKITDNSAFCICEPEGNKG